MKRIISVTSGLLGNITGELLFCLFGLEDEVRGDDSELLEQLVEVVVTGSEWLTVRIFVS